MLTFLKLNSKISVLYYSKMIWSGYSIVAFCPTTIINMYGLAWNRFRIPDIVLDPPLSEVQMTVDEIVESITAAARG